MASDVDHLKPLRSSRTLAELVEIAPDTQAAPPHSGQPMWAWLDRALNTAQPQRGRHRQTV